MTDAASRRLIALAEIGAVALLVALGLLLYRHEADAIEHRVAERETVRADQLANFARSDLQSVINDLRILADGDGLRAFLATGSETDLARARYRAVFFSRLHPEYDKIRFLDESGREVLRVNQGGVIVAPAELQDKSSRPFFQRGIRLASGELYVSAFDLNEDNDRLEVPLKPTIRFSTPIFDAAGRRRGIYVVNFLGRALIARLGQTAPLVAERLRLLNAEGYWLKAADPKSEWGFNLPERVDATLAKTDPALWRQIAAAADGQQAWHGGLFTWQRIDPTSLGGNGTGRIVADDRFWVVGSEVTADEMARLLEGIRHIFSEGAPALLVLAVSSLWFLRNRRRSARRIRDLYDLAPCGYHSLDAGGRIVAMNETERNWFGLTAGEVIGKMTFPDLLTPESREVFARQFPEFKRKGSLSGLELWARRKDGTTFPVLINATAIRDAHGRYVASRSTLFDITKRKQAELELDRFFSLSLDFLCISSADGYFKRVSPAVTDILGWSVAEFLAQPYLDLVHPDDREATRAEVERQMSRGEKVMQFENRYRHKDGSWRILSWRSVPQPGGLMYATARDVTERRRIEDEVRRLNADLQRHAAQLESTNAELESFSYTVSHDLRAPLRHVRGFVELLVSDRESSVSATGRHYLDTIAQSARNMDQLIDDLLEFSRTSRVRMAEQNVDLNRMVAEVRAGLAPAIDGRRVEWSVAALPEVRGDPALLRQVLVNLLGNAVKYSRKREPAEIVIGVAGTEAGRPVFFVRDNGAGFDMRYREKLFAVFQRLHRADEFEGTGIGLATVRRIITRHGGRTWAEGAIDRGATFYFTLEAASAAGGCGN